VKETEPINVLKEFIMNLPAKHLLREEAVKNLRFLEGIQQGVERFFRVEEIVQKTLASNNFIRTREELINSTDSKVL